MSSARQTSRLSTAMRRFATCLCVAVLSGCAGSTKTERQPAPARPVVAGQTATPGQAQPAQQRAPVIVEGTGSLVGTPRAAPNAASAATDGYQLSFVDTEIGSVVASVIGDGLGLPYIVDPQVKGTMTLQAARPLARDEVLPALEAALNAHGVALVDADGVYQVVLMKDAARRVSGLRAAGAHRTGFAIQIVPLKYVGAADMEKALRPFAPDGGILRVDEGRNLLVIAGTSRELRVMREVVETFDVNWLTGMSFAMFPVEYVDAKTLADELGAIFADARSPIANVVRLVPLSRLNSLMVVTHEPSYLKEVESWVKRLDVGATTPGRRIYVYDVQNGKADDLAESLSKILSISFETTVEVSADDGGSFDTGATFRSTPSSSSRSTVATRESADVPMLGSRSNGTPGALKIVPNTENNALLIYATPNEFTTIESALKRLDVTPIQVLIEASLAEVSLTDDLRFGLQWMFQGGDGPLTFSDASNGAISQRFPGFSYLFTGQTDIRAVLNALETITDVDVISSPKLLVLNNREAELQIGDQVPIVIQSAVSTIDNDAAIVNSVQLRDTGVILRITPRVNKSGLVLLDVAQEVSEVVPTTSSNIDSPTIQQRRIASSVAVRDGETIALGGLIRDSKSRTRNGLPLVARIPLIGALLGSTNRNKRRTELIVLITPRVIRSQEEADAMMDELQEQFRGLQRSFPEWTGRGSASKNGATDASASADSSAAEPAPPQ